MRLGSLYVSCMANVRVIFESQNPPLMSRHVTNLTMKMAMMLWMMMIMVTMFMIDGDEDEDEFNDKKYNEMLSTIMTLIKYMIVSHISIVPCCQKV